MAIKKRPAPSQMPSAIPGVGRGPIASLQPPSVVVWNAGEEDASSHLLPPGAARLTQTQGRVVGALQKSAAYVVAAHDDMNRTVAAARDVGVTWEVIGWSVGLTNEAARQRFKRFTA